MLSQIHTNCKNCVFATFNDKLQTGCSLNKLQDYEKAGIEVADGYDDDGNEFKIINGRFCLFYRNPDVMSVYPKDTWAKVVKEQTKIPYHVLILIEDDHTFSQVKECLFQWRDQDIRPSMVTLINKQYLKYRTHGPEKYIRPSKLLELLQNFHFHQHSLKNVYNDELSDRELIDLVFDSSKYLPYPFYAVFKVGFNVPVHFSTELNNAILIQMLQLGFAHPVDDINGMVVNRITHKKHSGNSFGINLEDKILAEEECGEKFIFRIEDICPSLQR